MNRFNGKAVIEDEAFNQDRILIPSHEEGKVYHAFHNDKNGLFDAAISKPIHTECAF